MSQPMLARTYVDESERALIETRSPSVDEAEVFGTHALLEPAMFGKPADVPEGYVAYNPSAIWTVKGKDGAAYDVMYVRVEPDRSSSESSHLGRSVVRPYRVDPRNPITPLQPFYEAAEMVGEDAALTRINRGLANGKFESAWLLSCVDPRPMAGQPNAVETLTTRFYIGTSLGNLEHIADGPEWMKDIRISQSGGPLGTELDVYGRPQTEANSGNITHTKIASINDLTAETIAGARYIDEALLPIGSGRWGGVNDVIRLSDDRNILAAHRAWRTGDDGRGRHYESVLYGHNTKTGAIVDLGVFATADMFPQGTVKDDTLVDLSDVVFTGGGYNGNLEYVSFGLRDGGLGIGGLRRIK